MSRVRIVPISDAFIASLLGHGTREAHVSANPLPPDAQLISAYYDGRDLRLTYVSKEFDEVPAGQPIPYLEPVFTAGPPPDAEARRGY